MRRIPSWIAGVAGALTAIAAWWWSSEEADSLFYPALPKVVTSTIGFWFTGDGADDLLSSLTNLAAGLLGGIVAGLVIGLIIGQHPLLRIALTPSFEFVRAIPATALIPFAMVIFGLGPTMKIFIIALGTFFPVLLASIDGVRAIPAEALDTARAFGITGWARQRHVVIPASLSRAVPGIRIAIPLSLVLMVTSEMTGSSQGVGYVLVTAQNSFNQVAVWAAIALLGILGLVLEAMFSILERRILAWDRGAHRR